jgi:SAM-dependent methyltransferase
MTQDLRDSYNRISPDYLRKKAVPWIDFVRYLKSVGWNNHGSVLDIGGGNGRNLNPIPANYHIVLDLSLELLRGYCGPQDGDRVAGVLPQLPFRKYSSTYSVCLAVIHHFRDRKDAVKALREIKRVTEGNSIISVWRRWRKGHREQIFQKLKQKQEFQELIDHERPWKSSSGEIVATRFYHYYTFKELHNELKLSGYQIISVQYLGGIHDDANIFVEVV